MIGDCLDALPRYSLCDEIDTASNMECNDQSKNVMSTQVSKFAEGKIGPPEEGDTLYTSTQLSATRLVLTAVDKSVASSSEISTTRVGIQGALSLSDHDVQCPAQPYSNFDSMQQKSDELSENVFLCSFSPTSSDCESDFDEKSSAKDIELDTSNVKTDALNNLPSSSKSFSIPANFDLSIANEEIVQPDQDATAITNHAEIDYVLGKLPVGIGKKGNELELNADEVDLRTSPSLKDGNPKCRDKQISFKNPLETILDHSLPKKTTMTTVVSAAGVICSDGKGAKNDHNESLLVDSQNCSFQQEVSKEFKATEIGSEISLRNKDCEFSTRTCNPNVADSPATKPTGISDTMAVNQRYSSSVFGSFRPLPTPSTLPVSSSKKTSTDCTDSPLYSQSSISVEVPKRQNSEFSGSNTTTKNNESTKPGDSSLNQVHLNLSDCFLNEKRSSVDCEKRIALVKHSSKSESCVDSEKQVILRITKDTNGDLVLSYAGDDSKGTKVLKINPQTLSIKDQTTPTLNFANTKTVQAVANNVSTGSSLYSAKRPIYSDEGPQPKKSAAPTTETSPNYVPSRGLNSQITTQYRTVSASTGIEARQDVLSNKSTSNARKRPRRGKPTGRFAFSNFSYRHEDKNGNNQLVNRTAQNSAGNHLSASNVITPEFHPSCKVTSTTGAQLQTKYVQEDIANAKGIENYGSQFNGVTTTSVQINNCNRKNPTVFSLEHPEDRILSIAKKSPPNIVNVGQQHNKNGPRPECFDSCRKHSKTRPSLGSIDMQQLSALAGCEMDVPVYEVESGSESDEAISKESEPIPIVAMNQLDHLFDKMSEFEKDSLVEPSDAVKTKLLVHQKMALNWMIKRENTDELPPFWCQLSPRLFYNEATLHKTYDRPKCINGGILADDMGLGKTLVLIALILTNHTNGEPMFRKKEGQHKHNSPENDPLLRKIKEESGSIKVKRNKEGFTKSISKRNSTLKEPGAQFRKLFLDQLCKDKKGRSKSKSKKKKESKSPKESNSSSIILSDSDDEFPDFSSHVSNLIQSPLLTANEEKPKAGLFGEKVTGERTLVVCPVSVLSNWTDQFECHVSPGIDLNIYVFYGPDRVRDINFLKQQDVVLTTYSTLANDFKQGGSVLHKINWLRVILDEGHCIRNPHAQQTKTMRELSASRRWIVTGTPIQNRMTDLWSVLKFLRLDPFTTRSWWKGQVVAKINRSNPQVASFDRVQKILRHISIRRMKTDTINGRPIVELPDKILNLCKIELGEEERIAYDAMQKDGKLIVCKYFRRGAKYLLRNYANVLAIIMRLRQMCCHPGLCKKAIKEMEKARGILQDLRDQERLQQQEADENDINEKGAVGAETGDDDDISDEDRERLIQQLIQILNTGDSEDCAICLETLKEPVITRCAHVFCNGCITEVIESMDLHSVCPMCRSNIATKELLRVPEKQKDVDQETISECEDDEEWHSSAKIDSLMESLEDLRKTEPDIKCLVVSQFTSFLTLIEKPLRDRGFLFVRFDGTLNQKDRTTAIEEFNSSHADSPMIMLLSLTAGGVGLNLSRASRVFLLDPAWNPAVEEQCFDRCHRLGQTRKVIITKYVVRDSIEERMLTLQEKKRELVNNAFGVANQTNEERMNARLQAIMTLMDM